MKRCDHKWKFAGYMYVLGTLRKSAFWCPRCGTLKKPTFSMTKGHHYKYLRVEKK